MKIFFIVLIFLTPVSIFCQEQNEYITVVGDSLIGKLTGGESIREVNGNVVLTQGDVRITCNKAIQFISRNDAELIGNVIVTQDTLTIITERAFYYGNERKAESTTGVKLDDKKVILTADTGDYYFNEDRAFFKSNVRLYDTATVLTSKTLNYYRHEDRMISSGDVKIVDSTNVIEADNLQHFRKNRVSIANNNVKITSQENNVVIYGDHLEDYADSSYTLINKNPLLVQVDTTFIRRDSTTALESDTASFRLDTLIIKSRVMESFRDTINLYKATDSVEIVRGGFASKNDLTIYFRNLGKIITNRTGRNNPQPVMWNENAQLTGDSVVIYLQENRIQQMEIISGAFLISQNTDYPKRYDQISGDKINMYFDSGEIASTEVNGSEYSIYFLYEDNFPNGVNKSSSQSAKIYFGNKKVTQVHLYGSPVSEYYPEHKVLGNEQTFTLPGFKIIENRPSKNVLLGSIRIRKNI